MIVVDVVVAAAVDVFIVVVVVVFIVVVFIVVVVASTDVACMVTTPSTLTLGQINILFNAARQTIQLSSRIGSNRYLLGRQKRIGAIGGTWRAYAATRTGCARRSTSWSARLFMQQRIKEVGQHTFAAGRSRR